MSNNSDWAPGDALRAFLEEQREHRAREEKRLEERRRALIHLRDVLFATPLTTLGYTRKWGDDEQGDS